MPSLDGGHYFLTVFAPVRLDSESDPNLQVSRSHRHLLAQDLALLPVGHATSHSDPDAPPSPFARNTLNHLARFVIIEGPPYNGRLADDTLVALIRNVDPLVAQPVDAFRCPYLLFAADIDARSGPDPLGDYAATLWSTMANELTTVFAHCVGFEDVTDAAGFTAYLRKCEVETTMPFNDYWAESLQAPTPAWTPPIRTAKALGGVSLIALVGLSLLAVVTRGWGAGVVVFVGVALLALLVFALFAWLTYKTILRLGQVPYPAAPTSDLNSVLKSLYIQQKFTQFAIDAQGDDEPSLHKRFGDFLTLHQPGAPTPTQAAGLPKAP